MPDFSLIDGFRMIDVDGLGYITPQNLAGFLQRNGIRQCEETIDGVLYRLDKDRDGNLNYTEFIDSVMPSDPRFHPKLKMRSVIDPSYTHSSLVHSSTPNKSQRTTKSPKKRPLSAKDKKSVSKSINFESPTKSKNMVQRNKARIVNSNLNVDVLRLKEKKELIALASIFKDHIILDKDLEKIKDQLALRLDFTIQDLFLHFSNSNSGSISELEFEIGLKSFKIFPQGNSFFLLFRRYDRNSDGRLDLQDFWNLFTPRACNYSHLLKSRFSSAKFRGKFSIETNELIKECFRNLFIAEESLEGMRIRLHSRPNFNASSIYELLVNPRQDYITTNEFRDVLRRANYFPTEKDLDALFSFFDTNKDGKVTYHEFTRALVPKFS